MKSILSLVVLFFFVGCQTAPKLSPVRNVSRVPQKGGGIALDLNHSEEQRASADIMMQKTCENSPVKIKQEGEVASKEWQIVYDCGSSKTKKR